MPIPEQQLEIWSHQGATTTASQTYTSVQAALNQIVWPPQNAPTIRLQGSYRNATNIYSESDVDIVVKIGNVFISDVSALTPLQAATQLPPSEPAQYGWLAGYSDTMNGLRAYYGQNSVSAGRKAIRVATPYRNADVVVAIEHRRYLPPLGVGNLEFVPGIAIWVPSESRWMTNHPELHYDNGVAKNASTYSRFKPAVRMFKNAALRAAALGLLQNSQPSYASECLVYNAPNNLFVAQYQQTFLNVLNWAAANIATLRRVSEQGVYVGNALGQWPIADAQAYITGLANLWDQY